MPLKDILYAARRFVGMAVVLFLLGAILGGVVPSLADPMLEALRDYVMPLEEAGFAEIAFFIFWKNAVAALIAIGLGPLGGIFPGWSALVNGVVVGAVIAAEAGRSWLLVPHGIFELPAIFLAWGLGLWLGEAIFNHERWRLLRVRLGAAFRVYAAIVLPLLVLAAVVEALLINHLQP